MDVLPYWSYETRKKTLELWQQMWSKRDAFDIDEFTLAGLVWQFLGNNPGNKALRCVYCFTLIDCWKPGDNPWIEHVKIAPSCIHMLVKFGTEKIDRLLAREDGDFYVDPQYIPLGITQRDKNTCNPHLFDELKPLLRVPQRGHGDNDDLQGACGQSVPVYTTNGGRQFKAAKIPNMRPRSSRKQTFINIATNVATNVDVLVENGLFYDATTGHLKCYYCGEEFPYSVFKGEMDPWIIHASNSDCFHVIMTKGEDFLDKARAIAGVHRHGQSTELQISCAFQELKPLCLHQTLCCGHLFESRHKATILMSGDNRRFDVGIKINVGYKWFTDSDHESRPEVPSRRKRTRDGDFREPEEPVVRTCTGQKRSRDEENGEDEDDEGRQNKVLRDRADAAGPVGATSGRRHSRGNVGRCHRCKGLTENLTTSLRNKNKVCDRCIQNE